MHVALSGWGFEASHLQTLTTTPLPPAAPPALSHQSPPTKIGRLSSKHRGQQGRLEVGNEPNTSLGAINMDEVRSHGNHVQQAKLPAGYVPITVELARQAQALYGPFTDQRSAAWHAVRERVLTASMVGYILGFSETGSRKPLGLPSGSWWTSREQTVAYFRRLYGEQQLDGSPPPACLWGCNHEANNTMLLLRCYTKVQCLRGFSTVKVHSTA